MTIAASSLLIAMLAAPATVDTMRPVAPVAEPAPVAASIPAIRLTPIAEEAERQAVQGDRFAPRWAYEGKRPAAMPAMYAGFGVLQALDIYSTRRAVASGSTEVNPLMGATSKNTAAMVAVKGASTALTIYFAERAWKRNRKGGMILMGVINGVTAAVVMRNMQNVK